MVGLDDCRHCPFQLHNSGLMQSATWTAVVQTFIHKETMFQLELDRYIGTTHNRGQLWDKAFQYTIVTITIGLTIGSSHNWDNQLSGQSGKCAIGQALVST